MRWLEETHGSRFELLRHFLGRMFDSEICAVRGQWVRVAVGAFALLLPAGMLLIREGTFDREAVLADELAVQTAVMAITGLVAVLQWQALFPGRRDYLCLAGLPVRARDIFVSRFGAVLLFAAAFVFTLNFLPSLIAPLEFAGRSQQKLPYLARTAAQGASSALGCFFAFFSVVAIQGLLLNTLPRRLFARVSVCVQGALSGVLVLAALTTRFIQDWNQERFAAWAPPVWFESLRDVLLGGRNPFLIAMAYRALAALSVAVTLTGLTYMLSYRRYRSLLIEAPVEIPPPRKRQWRLLGLLARTPRQAAILQFMTAAMVRSRTHSLIVLACAASAIGLLLNSSLLAGQALDWHEGWRAALQFAFLFWPLGLSAIILPSFRHAFSIPVELRANWVFQLNESHGRREWMSAVERFIVIFGIVPIYAVAVPVGVAVLGWQLAFRTAALQVLVSLSMCEVLFYSWQQLPFTCSYRPGKRPLPALVASYLVVLGVIIPVVARIVAVVSQMIETFVVYFAIFASVWIWWRSLRREGWGEANLIYEDLEEVAPNLGIKDVSYGRPRPGFSP